MLPVVTHGNLKDDGSLWSVGSNLNGELGVDDGTRPREHQYIKSKMGE